MKLYQIFAGFFTGWIFLHLSISSYDETSSYKLNFHNSGSKNLQLHLSGEANLDRIVFHEELGNEKKIFILNSKGETESTFYFPPRERVIHEGRPVSIPGSDGFLTYPYNGEYFIWFPRLGRHIYYFDREGSFLWRKAESRYLQAFPAGRFIMMSAGDHTRTLFTNPNLGLIDDIEGMLMIKYRLSDREDASWHACLAHLGGEAVLVNLEKPQHLRLPFDGPVKNISCLFDSGHLLVQTEKKEQGSYFDSFAVYEHLPGEDNAFRKVHSIDTTESYPYSVPMSLINARSFALLVPSGDSFELWLTAENSIYARFNLSEVVRSRGDVSNWRAERAGRNIVFWNREHMLIVDENGLSAARQFKNLHRVFSEKNYIYFQTENGLTSYRL